MSQNEIEVLNPLLHAASHTNEYTPNVKGRLKENISFLEKIGASRWVLSILRDGYALPFISEPEPKIFQNNVSALRNKEFVTNEILDLTQGEVGM